MSNGLILVDVMEASDSEIDYSIRNDDKNYLSWLHSQEYLVIQSSHQIPNFLLYYIKHITTMTSIRRLALFLGALLPAVLAAPAALHKEPEAVPNKFIITLKEGVSIDTDSHLAWVNDIHRRSLTKRSTAGVEKTYNIHTWNAYAGEFDAETIEQIKSSPDVRVCCILTIKNKKN